MLFFFYSFLMPLAHLVACLLVKKNMFSVFKLVLEVIVFVAVV